MYIHRKLKNQSSFIILFFFLSYVYENSGLAHRFFRLDKAGDTEVQCVHHRVDQDVDPLDLP